MSYINHPKVDIKSIPNKCKVSTTSYTTAVRTAYQIPDVIAALHRSRMDGREHLYLDTASTINLSFNFPQRDKIKKMVKTHIGQS